MMNGQESATGQVIQVVMLGIGDEVFALEASLVREIIDPIPVTRVAGAKSFLPGVINVRGNIVPFADIRERFGMAVHEGTADRRFVVIEPEIDGEPVVVALLADKVHEVTQIDLAAAQATPKVGTRWRPEFIRHIAKWNGDFVIVPEIERILN